MATAQFGVRLPVAGPLAEPKAITEIAKLSEALGFSHVSVHDFVSWSRFQDRTHISCGSLEAVEDAGETHVPTFFESLTTLGYVAAKTERIRLLVSVLVLPYRHPVVAAKQIATVDSLSAGRLTLGIGVGAARSTHNTDFEVLGVPRTGKYDRTVDYFRAMQALWTQDPASYAGEYVEFPATESYPKPVQQPMPIWVGGAGPKSVDIAARFGTGWIPPWIDPHGYSSRIADLYAQAATHGRSDVQFDIGTSVHACVDQTDDAAQKHASRTTGVLTEGFAADATQDAVTRAGLVGSPATVGQRLLEYAEAGVQHFELRFVYRTLQHLHEQLHLFQEEVMPQLETA